MTVLYSSTMFLVYVESYKLGRPFDVFHKPRSSVTRREPGLICVALLNICRARYAKATNDLDFENHISSVSRSGDL
jgi:hypothetical protein